MKMTKILLRYFIISIAWLTVAANTWQISTADAWPDDGITAITIPSEDVTLSFIQPGQVAEVHVREGDQVKTGQVLIRQDDAAEQAQLSMLREQSRDTTQIKAREASLAQKKVYLDKLEWAAERSSATELEVEDAKLEVIIDGFLLEVALFEHEQNKKKYKEAKIRVNNMRLKSPIDGRVEKIEVEDGESIDGLSDALRVVKIDPLWIDVHLPLEKGRTLSLDQTANIIFSGNEQKVSGGKIIFISTVADAASSTLRVRIEVPNESNRPVGEHVSVLFSTP